MNAFAQAENRYPRDSRTMLPASCPRDTQPGGGVSRYDFQGATEVNAAIRKTLASDRTPDFWWLNNGVTILSSRSGIDGDKIRISDPQIVNGLQTSTQISLHYNADGDQADTRSVMVKILSSEDDEVV